MRKRSEDPGSREVAVPKKSPLVTDIPHDVVGEQAILAAVIADWSGEAAKLLDKYASDTFLAEEHRAAWVGLQELRRRKLGYDPAILARYAGQKCDVDYVQKVAEMRPDALASRDLGHFVDGLVWDRQRATAVTGPISALVEALQDPKSDPARVKALAKHVGESFESGTGRGRYLHDGAELVRTQMEEVRKRIAGRANWQYGIPGLDTDLETGEKRLLPGPAPGQVTLLTAVSGSGKTTMAGRMTLGIARQRRKVLYGAYEMGGGMTLELLACMSLGWSRSRLMKGYAQDSEAPPKTPMSTFEQAQLSTRMDEIAKWVTFMRNPFRQRGTKRSNERNLDTIQEQIVDSGCDVFVADLWKRCLVDTRPDQEEDALMQQQVMAEETKVHCILLQQQRAKDIEARSDPRPTREGVKGSGAWVEVADTIIGCHLPHLWKELAPDKMEVFVLKQRHGVWPLAVEMDWSADHGSITGGVSIEYKRAQQQGSAGGFGDGFVEATLTGGKRRRGKGA